MIGSLSRSHTTGIVGVFSSWRAFEFLSFAGLHVGSVFFFPSPFNTFHYLRLREILETFALFGLARQCPLAAVCNKAICSLTWSIATMQMQLYGAAFFHCIHLTRWGFVDNYLTSSLSGWCLFKWCVIKCFVWFLPVLQTEYSLHTRGI